MGTETRLDKALNFSTYRETLNNQLMVLRLNKSAELQIFSNGGAFTIDRELIVFVDMLVQRGISEVVLLDDNDTPIKITDLTEFSTNILDQYFCITNDFYNAYEHTRQQRDVQSVLDLDE